MTIAVTSGDPSGIGPEIVQKSWIYLKNNPIELEASHIHSHDDKSKQISDFLRKSSASLNKLMIFSENHVFY